MNEKTQSLQDTFLDILCKERMPVAIYLVNGIKLVGQIEAFDAYVVLLRGDVTQVVYKHGISTIVPARPVNLPFGRPTEEGAASGNGNNAGRVRTPFGFRNKSSY